MSAVWLESDRLEGGYDRSLIRWVLAYARPHRAALAGCVVLLLALAALQLAQPWIISQAIDRVLSVPPAPGSGALLGQLVLAYLAVVVAAAAVHYAQLLWLRLTGQRIIGQVRQDAFDHLQRLDVAYFDRQPTGRTVTRVTNDVEALNEVYTSVLVNLFRDLFFMAGAALVLLRMDGRLALLTFAMLPVVALVAVRFRRASRSAWRAMRARLAAINASLAETLSGVRVIQLFNREALSAAEFKAVNDDHYHASRRLIRVFATYSPALDLLTSITLAGLVWYGGGQALAGAITVGTLYAFTAYARRLYEPVNALAEKFNILQSALAAAERISAFLAIAPEVTEPADAGVPPAGEAPVAVHFEHVWFAYEGEDWVLRDVSFSVRPGETVAFVGRTGAGKSTLMNLVPRFYDVQAGLVAVDGLDVRRWRLAELRRRVGAVMQDVFLFAGDVAGNIALGEPGIDRAAVERAAVTVGADPFIRRLPGGYGAPVAERGQTLATGQRQLIAFARALAFDPAILILDEATASVDSETEAALQQAMREATRGRTTLIVAHRLSTVQDADRIYVLDQGRIVESGRHGELLALGGLYRSLWDERPGVRPQAR
jgi:ABC-type multidrug transport system fused ATPase/permease subunit